MQRENVTVRRPGRRRGPAIAGRSKIRASLQSSSRQPFSASAVRRKLFHRSRNVRDDPVPPARPGRRIRIVRREDKTLGAFRRAFPSQMRRTVAARVAHSLEHLSLGHPSTLFEIVTPQAKTHPSSPFKLSPRASRVDRLAKPHGKTTRRQELDFSPFDSSRMSESEKPRWKSRHNSLAGLASHEAGDRFPLHVYSHRTRRRHVHLRHGGTHYCNQLRKWFGGNVHLRSSRQSRRPFGGNRRRRGRNVHLYPEPCRASIW